jgi:iron(III) transport system ATP-binding protein
MTVAENIAFGLFKLSATARQQRVQHLLELVGLVRYQHQYPHELSGGQQQRVALVRALAPKPDLILLDEPFSSLDVALRERLSLEVRDILKAEQTTAILVTHDQQEAFSMSDQVGVMDAGHIVQWDTPYQIYHQPISRKVADFIGHGAFVVGQRVLQQHAGVWHETIQVDLGDICVASPSKPMTELSSLPLDHHQGQVHLKGSLTQTVDVLVRPDDIVHDDHSIVQAEVIHKIFRGADFFYELRLPNGVEILAMVPSHHDHALGEHIGIHLDMAHIIYYPQTTPASVPSHG